MIKKSILCTALIALISGCGDNKKTEEEKKNLTKAESKNIEEYGVVTGRRRRVGLFDMELAKESCRINGATQIALTCVDRLYPDCARTQSYDDLSAETKKFVEEIQSETGVPVTIISTGPDLKDTIDLRKELL